MIDLSQPSEHYDIELPYGLTVTVKLLTTAGMAAAQAAARRAVEAIERQITERKEAGLPTDSLPDLADEGERDGLYQAQLIRELAVRHITDWTGIERDDGQPRQHPTISPRPIDLYPVGERFFQEFTLRQVLLNAAKNGSGLSVTGTSSQAEGPNTAEDVERRTCHAPEESVAATDRSAPTASTP